MSPCCRYFGLLASRFKKAFSSCGFGWRAQSCPDRRAGHDQIARAQPLESRQRLQRLQRWVDHVAVDERVLAYFAVDLQFEAQTAEAVEFVGVEKYQGRADRGECWIRPGFSRHPRAKSPATDSPAAVTAQPTMPCIASRWCARRPIHKRATTSSVKTPTAAPKKRFCAYSNEPLPAKYSAC
jgi:hypothetical protein